MNLHRAFFRYQNTSSRREDFTATDMGNFQDTENIIWPITWKTEMHKEGFQKESMTDSCEIIFSLGEWLKTVEMKKFVVHGTFLQIKITPIICKKKNTFYYKNNWWIFLNKSGNDTQPLRERSDFKQALSTLKTFTSRSWRRPTRAHSLLEVQTMETSIDFFLYLVAMTRILVVCKQRLVIDRGNLFCFRTLAKTSDEWLSIIHFLQLDRLQLAAVYCNRRGV